MASTVTVVGRVVGDPVGDELVIELDDTATLRCEADPALFGLRLPQHGDRVAVRATVLEAGEPHPARVRAVRVALGSTGGTDNELIAAVDDDEHVRRGERKAAVALPAEVEARRARRDRDNRAGGRPPLYRVGAGLAIAGGLMLGLGLAGWAGSIDELRHLPPPGWSATVLVLGLWASILAAAVAAARPPFEVARGRRGVGGRPAWNLLFLIVMSGLFAATYAGFVYLTRDAVSLAALACLPVGALGGGLTLYTAIKLRRPLTFGHRLFWGPARLGGVVEGDGVEHRVRYVNRSKSREVQVTNKRGQTDWVTRTESWIDASSAVSGADTLRLRTASGSRDVELSSDVTWSAPIRYARPDDQSSAVSITRIEPGDHVIVVGDKAALLFAAPSAPRRALAVAFAGYLARVGWLIALTVATFALASRLWHAG